ncbi:MAG: SnoaL-like domain-containing protein [Dactylosporangium sp.]|nr:ester cyclase [Dactylosporangium sp.]NNJ60340.1 SnoaL-like domain-containing protein [Dactylosporangium sp.]
MNQAEARALIEPFYDLFRADRRDWDAGFAVLADGWRSYYTNTEYRTKADTRPYIEGLFKIVPDINVEVLQVAVDGPVIAVRSELSGTPQTDFMVPHSGRPFSIMTIDLHQVDADGRIATLHHLEDWGTAITQLRGEQEGKQA